MKRLALSIAGFTIAATLLAGCSGGDADTGDVGNTDGPAPTTSPTIVADGDTSTPKPTVGNLDDPLCAAAQASVETASNLQSKTNDLTTMLQDPTFLTSEDPAALNRWGEDMVTLSSDTLTFYEVGVAETSGDPVNADFVTLSDFVNKYTLLLANAAKDAESPTAFMTSIQTTFADEDVQAAAAAAPAAAQNVATYLGTRCDITS